MSGGKSRIAIAAAGAVAVSLLGAPATAGPIPVYSQQGSFRPIGDAPNFQWAPDAQNKFAGTGSSLHTTPGPNVLVDLSDSTGVSLVNLPADLVVFAQFQGYLGDAVPAAAFFIQLIYDGPTPFVVEGVTVHSGTVLTTLRPDGFGEPFSLAGGSAHDDGGGSILHDPAASVGATDLTLVNSPGPVVHFDPEFGNRPFVDAGVGQLSGTFSANSLPEPGAWALMILGFAALGARLRRRPRPFAA